MRRASFVAVAALLVAGPLSAQAWDAPSFFSPRPGEDIGVYLVDADGADDLGIVGIWRHEGNINLGVRAGLLDGDRFSVGGELYGPLDLFSPGTPLLLSWVVGLGGTFNGATWLRIPAGVSLGGVIDAGQVSIMPYIHPRIAFDYVSFDAPAGVDDSDSELNFDLDVGADVGLGRQFVLRVGATIGDWDALGIGIAYRLGRRVAVR